MVKLKKETPSLKGSGTRLQRSAPNLKSKRATLHKQQVSVTAAGQDGEIPTEAAAAEELSEVLSGFKARASREVDRFYDATDSEFWIAVCFQNREQKEEFLQKLELDARLHGDKYLDGMVVARKLGITLETEVPPTPTLRIDSKVLGISRPIRGEGDE